MSLSMRWPPGPGVDQEGAGLTERVQHAAVARTRIRTTAIHSGDMDPSPWEFGWNALTAIGTLAAASAAVWLGWGSRKHTNLLLEADQRKQASLLRVHQPQV